MTIIPEFFCFCAAVVNNFLAQSPGHEILQGS
jgi:hypothetical protein